MDNQNQFDLDRTLMEFTEGDKTSKFTYRMACEGISITGNTGGGKTSGSGNIIAVKNLEAGFGGLVLTTKADEKELWQEYCRRTNRLDDLVIIEPGGKHSFNFLEYESSNKDGQVSFTANVVQLLKTVIKANEERESGHSDDQFWQKSLEQLIFFVIELEMLAYSKVSVQKMYDIALSAPKGNDSNAEQEETDFTRALDAARKIVLKNYNTWEKKLGKRKLSKLEKNPELAEQTRKDEIEGYSRLKMVDQFFVETYRNLSEKTRSIINMYFTGFLFNLLQEPMYSLFCRQSTITPEDCFDGKIILLNLPVKHYHKAGRDCQILFKYIWQRAMEKRKIEANSRIVFLWADEAQNFIHSLDTSFQSTCRSSKISVIYLSQNLPGYHANMGGAKSEHLVKSFLATLSTKIFHANTDSETNNYASELIGDAYTDDYTKNINMGADFSTGQSESFKLERMVRPEEFARLRTGGPLNNFIVSAYIHCQGKPFHTGFNHMKIFFKQTI